MLLVPVLPPVRLLRLSRLTRCVAGGGGVSDMKAQAAARELCHLQCMGCPFVHSCARVGKTSFKFNRLLVSCSSHSS